MRGPGVNEPVPGRGFFSGFVFAFAPALALLLTATPFLLLPAGGAVRAASPAAIPEAASHASAAGEITYLTGMKSAEITKQSLEEQIDALDLSQLEEFASRLDQDVQSVFPAVDLRALLREGGPQLDLRNLARVAFSSAARELVGGSRILAQLILISVMGALLALLQQAWESQPARDVILFALMLLVLFLSVQALRTAFSIALGATEQLTTFMYALLPVLGTLLASMGAVSSATVLHPLFLAVVAGVGLGLRQVVLPLTLMGLALRLAGTFAKDLPLGRLAGLAQTLSLTALGLGFTLFFGVLAIHGAVAPVTDSLGLRTAKFLSSSFIPVLGGMFAQAVDVVVGGSLLLRNAVGALGMAAVGVLVTFPLVKLALLVFGFKVAAAVVQPVADARLVELMGAVEGSLVFLGACVGVAALMFFLMILIAVTAGTFAANLV